MQDILTIQGVTKQFGGLTALRDVHASVREGGRLGIIGPNGAGKTTLFNCITGEFRPTAGAIQFRGEAIHGLKPHQISKKGIGRTFQIVRVFDALSVFENVLTGATSHELRWIPTEEQRHEVEEILRLTHLDKQRDVLGRNLTVAAKKRVGIATALATKPKLLLLDEAMAGLNFVEIEEALQLLRKLNGDMGIALVVVEHVMKVVMELCEKIVVISSGEKIAEGSPREVSENKKVIDVYLGESH